MGDDNVADLHGAVLGHKIVVDLPESSLDKFVKYWHFGGVTHAVVAQEVEVVWFDDDLTLSGGESACEVLWGTAS